MISPITKRYLTEAVAYAAAGIATKGVGSVYRLRDDLKAPKAIRSNTFKREATMLSIAGASMMAIQLLFTAVSRKPNFAPVMKKIFKSTEAFQQSEPLIRLFLAIPAFALAESISRVVGPRGLWGPNDALSKQNKQQKLTEFKSAKVLTKIKAKPIRQQRVQVQTGASLPSANTVSRSRAAFSPNAYSRPTVFNPSLSGYYEHRNQQATQLYFHA